MIVTIEREGKKYKVIVPDDADPKTWEYGVVVGPPDFSWLPPHIDARLHNELFNRNIIEYKDVISRVGEIQAALQSSLKIDQQLIIQAYREEAPNA